MNTTESALASKIRKTQETKARLEKTILEIELEIQNLTRVSAKLTKLLGRRKASLHTAEKRMQVVSILNRSYWGLDATVCRADSLSVAQIPLILQYSRRGFVQIRSLRPNRELTNDTVQLNLINQTDLLHQFIFRIERGLQAVNHNISRLQDARAALHADAMDKVPVPPSLCCLSCHGSIRI